ncbi:Hypothetical protein R9X50_00133200 [Acrodontium crateriforme]|uniref:Survival Motor Neuron Gemin2-binding domain-containing protein n=1 Tax=Acrodontium crateriforme TaxID=150365 RepID=A0AAQ3M2B1_9PEZI|nr:Hypothetical protein R9X50_00133200 [Acrodontium crateriforme]
MANKGYSHDEVWDDSALVNSWNDALQEYKKYHSLAVKGEKVPVAADKAKDNKFDNKDNNNIIGTKQEDPSSVTPHTNGPTTNPSDDNHEDAKQNAQAPAQSLPGAAAMPTALINGAQDESMKNLMMSWYYAGYYTGLYEGQQKAYAGMQHE